MNMKLLSGFFGIASLLASSLASAATVSVTPSSINVGVGDTFTVAVSGDFDNTGGDVVLAWDPTALQINSTAPQIRASLAANGFGGFVVAPLTIGPSSFNAAALTDLDPITLEALVVTGPFDFFNGVSFTALTGGSSQITLTSATFVGVDGVTPIAGLGIQNATVNVAAVPVPPAVWLFGSGLLGLVGVARRRAA